VDDNSNQILILMDYFDEFSNDNDNDKQDSLDVFNFNDSEEFKNYCFNSIDEDDKAKHSFRIDITNKNTQPTLNQNFTYENILDYYNLNESQNMKMNINANMDLYENQNMNIYLNENNIIKNKPKDKAKDRDEIKMLGRKKKNSNEAGKHDKYSEDNIIRKIKSTLLNYLRIFINSFIYEKFNGNIGEGIFRKEILKMNQQQITIGKYDKQFIKRTLKDIFSHKLSGKYSTFDSDHNKKLIEFLINEVDEEKKIEFQNLFSLTFMDSLNHFSGIQPLSILKGMKLLKDLCKKFEDDQTYVKLLKYYTFNFENTIEIKRSRKRSKK
jgi:hypothetical protein